jgi:predicted nucleotidyltransferase
MLSLEELKSRNLIVFEVLSGSRAFGLATETSDTDIKGVFIAPPGVFFGFDLLFH